MASSSSHKSHQDYKLKVEEGDWLELGLGLGFRKPEDHGSHPVSGPLSLTSAPSSSSSSLPLQTNLGLGLGLELRAGLGLGLGLSLKIDNESVRQVGMAPPSSNYHNLLCPDNCDPYHHYNYSNDDDEDEDEDGDDNSMPSSWPWHMESGGAFLGLHDWQMAVPNNSHDYSTPRPHPPGLWFTLRSLTNRDGEVLPQIPKAYIRVKDENVTVFMVKKYLVRKLGLSNEAQTIQSSPHAYGRLIESFDLFRVLMKEWAVLENDSPINGSL
ncbi:isoform 2 of e3 ubiquitin protein ligase drip1 [Fagus crenata]